MISRFALVLLLAAALPLSADDTSATMTVSARVLARAVVTMAGAPAEITVTEADLARGYVDVAEPLALRVRTNSRNGYLLQVANASEFAAIELAFGNTSMTVAAESWVARPYVAGGELVTAKVRVRLAAGTIAGRHPLPVEVSASPL